VFQGCTKARKNTENYCKKYLRSGVRFGYAQKCLGDTQDAQGIFPREFGNFESRGVG